MSEKIDGQFVRYYDLLAKSPNALQNDEKVELERLQDSLGEDGLMGDTPRERILYRIIDKQLTELRSRNVPHEWSDETITMIEQALAEDREYRERFSD
jgi:hypothetical protein